MALRDLYPPRREDGRKGDIGHVLVAGGSERYAGAVAFNALAALRAGADLWRKPLVLDAEALHAVVGLTFTGRSVLLTPHPSEFEVLSGMAWPQERADRLAATTALARRLGCVVLVKGSIDIISDGSRVHEDRFSTPFLTKGGHGDLLAGAAGALLARRPDDPFAVGCAAAELVGRAGMLAAKANGESTLASDTLASLPQAIREALA